MCGHQPPNCGCALCAGINWPQCGDLIMWWGHWDFPLPVWMIVTWTVLACGLMLPCRRSAPRHEPECAAIQQIDLACLHLDVDIYLWTDCQECVCVSAHSCRLSFMLTAHQNAKPVTAGSITSSRQMTYHSCLLSRDLLPLAICDPKGGALRQVESLIRVQFVQTTLMWSWSVH